MSRQERLTLVATILGSTVVFLDSTVVNVALPSISDNLDAGLAGQQWVVEAYMLTMVSLLLVGGSLGATAREAAAPTVRRSLRSGMITLVDSTKTTGLIFFPGTMVGMLLAGANPTDAVRLQLILLYTLIGSVAIAGVVATSLAYRNFFTPAQQLRDLGSES